MQFVFSSVLNFQRLIFSIFFYNAASDDLLTTMFMHNNLQTQTGMCVAFILKRAPGFSPDIIFISQHTPLPRSKPHPSAAPSISSLGPYLTKHNSNYVDLAPQPPSCLNGSLLVWIFLFIPISWSPCRHFQLLSPLGCNCLHANGRQTIVLNEVRPRGCAPDFIRS